MEEWKLFYSIKNIDYYVSSSGLVKSLRKVVQSRYPVKTYRVREKILARHSSMKRACVFIADNAFDVAELVAENFIGRPFDECTIVFKDGNFQNCDANNLLLVSSVPSSLEEEWRDIPGYEGRYQVSNLGNVRTLCFQRTKGNVRLLKPIVNSAGYYVVSLSGKQHFIHRLVAMCFCDNPYGYNVVDHINTVQTDNRAENLRWTTADGNVKNPLSHKKRMDRIMQTVPRKCVQMDLDGNRIRVWDSMKEACDSLGLHRGDLTNACQGKYRTCGGYKWKYYDL